MAWSYDCFMPTLLARLITMLCLACVSTAGLAHPGGLDTNGCHNDRKAGERHCHSDRLRTKALSTCELHTPPRAGEEGVFYGGFVRATDGDTFEAKVQGVVMDFRLAEADAPESDQPYGAAARKELFSLLRGQELVLVPIDTDRYGRTVVFVWVEDLCINREIVRRGAAWFYDEFSTSAALHAVENEARKAERGLWALPIEQRIEPQRWRREKR